MLLPVHGFVRGDAMGLLVLVQHDDTVEHFAKTLMAAAQVRVEPAATSRVYRSGVELSPEQTLASLGIEALERLDLVPGEPAVVDGGDR